MSQHGVVVEDRPQVARVGDRVDTLVQRRRDSVEQGRSLDAQEQSLGTRQSNSQRWRLLRASNLSFFKIKNSRMLFWMFSFTGWFWYLLNVWDRQELLQSGQEVQHEHLQRAVIFRPEIRGKHVLEQTRVQRTVLVPPVSIIQEWKRKKTAVKKKKKSTWKNLSFSSGSFISNST